MSERTSDDYSERGYFMSGYLFTPFSLDGLASVTAEEMFYQELDLTTKPKKIRLSSFLGLLGFSHRKTYYSVAKLNKHLVSEYGGVINIVDIANLELPKSNRKLVKAYSNFFSTVNKYAILVSNHSTNIRKLDKQLKEIKLSYEYYKMYNNIPDVQRMYVDTAQEAQREHERQRMICVLEAMYYPQAPNMLQAMRAKQELDILKVVAEEGE